MTDPASMQPEEEQQPAQNPVEAESNPPEPQVEVAEPAIEIETGNSLPDPAILYPEPKKKGLPVWAIVLLVIVLVLGAGFGTLRILEKSALDQAAAALDGGEYAAAEQAANRALALPLRSLLAQPARAYLLRGQALFEQGRLDDALTDLQAATRAYPNDASLQSGLARIYLAKGNLEEAYAAGAIAKAADDSLALPYALDALKAYNAYQWKDALAAAETAIQRGDDSGLALRLRGALELWSEDLKAADADLAKAAELAPQDIEVQALRVKLFNLVSKKSEANAALEKVKAISTESAVSLWAQGMVALENFQFSEAQEFANQALALEERPEFYILQAYSNVQESPEAEARYVASLENALKLQPDFVPALVSQADQQIALYQLTDIEPIAKRLDDLAPKGYSAPSLRCSFAMKYYELEDAVKYCNQAVERYPDLPELHASIGYVYAMQYKFDAAWKEIDAAFALDPTSRSALTAALYAAALHQDDEKAMGYADQILKANPEDVDAHAYKAFLFHSMGKHDEASTELNKAFQLDPYSVSAIQTRIQISLDNGDSLTALNDANDLIKRNPKNPDYFATRGRVYLNEGNLDKARQDANTALSFTKRNPSAYNVLAAVYMQEHEDSSAILNANMALKINPYQTEPYLILADIKYWSGKYDEFVANTEKAAALEPWNKELQFSLAFTYQKAGRIEEALAVLDALLAKKDDLDLTLLDNAESLAAFLRTVGPEVDGKRTQMNSEYGFSITYPTNWVPEPPGNLYADGDSIIWVISTIEDSFYFDLRLGVFEFDGAAQYPTSLWAQTIREQVVQNDGYQFYSSKPFKANGISGTVDDYQYDRTYPDGEVYTLRTKIYFFVKGDNLYLIQYMTVPENFFMKAAEVDEIVATFSLTD